MSKVYLNLFLIFIGLIVSLSAVSAGSFDSTQDGVLSIDGNSCYDSLNNNFGDNLSVGLDNYSIINTHNDNNINNITKNNITDNINNNELIQVNTNSNYSNFNCENINITVKNSNSSISNSNITLNNIDLILRNETLRNNLTKIIIIDNSTFIIKSKLSNVVIHHERNSLAKNIVSDEMFLVMDI